MTAREGALRGLLWGTLLASAFSALLAAGVLFRAILRHLYPEVAPPVGELPLAALVLGYFAGGIVAGVTFGLLWPGARRGIAPWLIGALAAVPFFLALRVALLGAGGWTGGDLVRLAAVSSAWALGTAALSRVRLRR
jgi:hypothetical protein